MSTNIFPKLKEVETVIINKQENVITHKTHIQRVSHDLINQFNDILNVDNRIDRQTLILNDNNFFQKKGVNTKLINMGESQRNTKKDNQVNLKLILTNDQIEASRKVAIQKEEDFLKNLKTELLLRRQPKKPTKPSEEEEEEDNDKPKKPKDSKPPKIGSIAPLQNTSTKPITSSPKSTKTTKESEEKPTEEKKIPKTQNVTKSVNSNGKDNEDDEEDEEDKKKLYNSI